MIRIFSGKAAIWVGRALMAISLLFIALRLWDYRHSVENELTNLRSLISTLVASGIYAGSGFLLALGWWMILGSRVSRGEGLAWNSAWRVYGKTQIAKYIPGNIFHFAGRHVLAAKQGATHAQLMLAATGEIAMMLVASGLFSLPAIGILFERIPHQSLLIWIMIVCLAAGLMVLGLIFRHFGFQKMISAIEWQKIIGAQFSYGCFVAVSLLLFLFLLFQVSGPLNNWFLITGGCALAWAIGFVVPGAPGGLGVREAMLVTFLSGVLEEKFILITAILFRIVTTLGDVLFFLIAGAKGKG